MFHGRLRRARNHPGRFTGSASWRGRRDFIAAVGCAAALPSAIFSASAQVVIAQSYPARPVRMIVPFPAGGQIDIVARVIAHWLSERLGQQFVVDNRPGAASNIATEALVRSPPDGHTLMFATVSNAVNATLFDKLNFDFIRDTVPVASINRIPLVLEVHPSFPALTVSDLVSEAKSKPGKINIVTPPKGTAPFMAAALFKVMSGVDVVHIPYRGTAQLMPDLLSGQVQVAFDGISSSLEYIRANKLRALAVATEGRLDDCPIFRPLAKRCQDSRLAVGVAWWLRRARRLKLLRGSTRISIWRSWMPRLCPGSQTWA